MKKLAEINRLELIDHIKPLEKGGGRTVLLWTKNNFIVNYDLQDNGRTLKIFISKPSSEVKGE